MEATPDDRWPSLTQVFCELRFHDWVYGETESGVLTRMCLVCDRRERHVQGVELCWINARED